MWMVEIYRAAKPWFLTCCATPLGEEGGDGGRLEGDPCVKRQLLSTPLNWVVHITLIR